MRLAAAVRAHAERWRTTAVERDVFGTGEPEEVARIVEAFCRDALGARLEDCLCYESSVGAVAGLVLVDRPPVLVKVHRRTAGVPRLRAMQAVMTSLRDAGFPCPRPLLAPTPLAEGLATVESCEPSATMPETGARRPRPRHPRRARRRAGGDDPAGAGDSGAPAAPTGPVVGSVQVCANGAQWDNQQQLCVPVCAP